ncbi:MAG: SEL1-like repeat protein [Methylobacterium sp.]|nr:SEL1-like repeat protein [Methylobacterium sp.]MCA3603410.1 SEL1-like repeat protein [Methylobacterium sp.]MCA3615095.1 SEL1-like repeat protein [Methylobacterium sp.]
MANAMPWSVRGIDPEIREQAVEAAHRSGLSVGEWLNQVLAGNIADEDDEPSPLRGRRRKAWRGEMLNDRLERLGRNRTATAAHRMRDSEPENGPENGRVLELIETAVQAIERLERKTAEASPAVARESSDLTRVVDELERRLAVPQRTPSGRPAALLRPGRIEDAEFQRAVSEIDERRRVLDEPAASRTAARSTNNKSIDAMRQQLDILLERIEDMRGQAGRENVPLQERIDQIAGRLENWQSRPNEDTALIRRDLASLAATIETLSPQRLFGMVENAVASVAEKSFGQHRSPLPERLLAPILEVQQEIRDILGELASSRSSDRLSQEVNLVARRLDEISRHSTDPARIEDLLRETNAIKSLIGQAVRAQPLEGLVFQMEALGKQLENFRSEPDRRAERAVMDAVQEIRDRVERLDPKAAFQSLEQRLSAIAAIEHRLGALTGIERRLDEIARDVSRIANDQQPLPQLDSIAERLERIDRVLGGTRNQPLAAFNSLVEKIDKLGTSLDRAQIPAASDELMDMLERLSAHMAEAETRSDAHVLDALQHEISRLGKKLDMTAGAPAGLEGLQKAVETLMNQFDEARTDLREAAAEAVERAAREAIRSIAREESTDTLAAEGLLLLKRDLGDFKTAQTEADRRTRQTLDALHGTLEGLANRLGGMQTGLPAPAARAAPSPPAPAPAPASAPASASGMPRAEIAPPGLPPATPMRMPEAAQKSAPSMTAPRGTSPADGPDDTPDLPLEPGLRPGQPRPVDSMPGASGTQAPAADPRANFIAAARRAAQAAAVQSHQVLSDEKTDRKAAKAARKAAKAATALTAGTDGSPRASFLARARKPILLGLVALVFITLGAMKFLLPRDSGEVPAPPAPPVIERPAAERTEPAKPQSVPERTGSIATPMVEPLGKRATRLTDSVPIAQADPMTVGSITAEGTARPIATGREVLAELGRETRITGQDRLRDAATGGNAAAIFELGARLADGRGVVRDPKLAARWFEQAAAQGHAPSQYRLASLYREGRGVAKDAALAFQWFDRAAAQGHVLAMHNAGVLLAEGVHGAPDYAGAALWFRRAAEHGVKDSQFNVAILFARGLGVNQDMGEAYRWFSLAAMQGDPDAGKKRDDIAARLSKEQVGKERDRLKAFKPTEPNLNANEPGNWDKTANLPFPPIGRPGTQAQ